MGFMLFADGSYMMMFGIDKVRNQYVKIFKDIFTKALLDNSATIESKSKRSFLP